MSKYKNVTKEEIYKRINMQKPKLRVLEEINENNDPNKRFKFVDDIGYLYSLSYNQLYETHHAIVKKINPYSIDNIKTFIRINNSKAEVVSTIWEGGDSKLKLKCEKCGKIFEARWYHIYGNHKFCCNKCSQSNPYNKKSIDNAIKLCKKHGYKIIEGTYKHRRQFDMIDKQGYKYSNCSVHTLNNRSNKFQRFSYINKYQIQNMLHYIRFNELDIRFANPNQCNVKNDEYIEVHCCECGDIYKATWEQLTGIKKDATLKLRCQKCSKSQSNLEYIVESYLKKKKINYVVQKRFSWCKNKRQLPFDFYLVDYNTVIEVQGGQQYNENKMFSITLEEQQKRDEFKKQCCINNNVNYIAIPYWLITQSRVKSYKKIIDNIIH